MPVRSTTLVAELVSTLEADIALETRLMAPGRIHPHRAPEAPSEAAWARVIARELKVPGGVREHATGLVQVSLQLMAEVSDTVPNPDLLLESIQERAEEVLRGFTYESAYGDTVLGIERTTRPSAAEYDDELRCFYSTSSFLATLTP